MTAQNDLRHARSLLQSGNLKATLKACKLGMRRYPKEPGFCNFAGLSLAQSGQLREAAEYFAKALKLDPGDQASQNNLVMALVQSGQNSRAASLISKLLEKRSEPGVLYYQLAMLEMNRGNYADALNAANNAIATHPAQAAAREYNLRAVIEEAMGDDDAAFADYKKALELEPNNVETLSNIALQLTRRLKPEEALESLEKALKINPMHLNALHRYGIQLNESGRQVEAAQAFTKALEIDPTNSDILRELAQVADKETLAHLKPKLDKELRAARKGTVDRARLAFAVAHSCERMNGAAETAYGTANRLTAAIRPYDVEKSRHEENAILGRFPINTQPELATDITGPLPIFVVGQPRSGTTLIEQVLSAHPEVLGTGEQAIVGRLSHAYVHSDDAYGAAEAMAFARDYRRSLPQHDTVRHGFVDKMPANYKYLGFVLTAFPNAVVLNITRDPRDVAWSMWRNWFPNAPMNYTFDMTAMADEANAYARFIAHWKAVFPDRITDVAYENVVTDITGYSKQLAALCDVAWHPDMAQPDRNAAPVRTASVTQVRQGVHSKSVGGWSHHTDTLAPFIERLDPGLWPGIA